MIMGVNVERGSRTLQGVSNLLPVDGRMHLPQPGTGSGG